MNGTIDPTLLALFAQVAEHGGVRIAAQASGLPRSTVSRKLAELEAQLGARLLQRSTRAVTLTEEGQVLLERVRPALLALADAESAVRALRERPTGTLKLAAPSLMAEVFLAPVLERYARRYPDVRVELCLEDRVVSLVDEGFDCALRAGPLADSSLVARKLGEGTQRVVASPDYLKTHDEPETPDALSRHDAIVFTGRKQASRWPFIVEGKKSLVTVTPKYKANSMVLVRELAKSGLGIAMLPTFITAESVRRGELRELLAGFPAPRGAVYVVYPSERHLAPRTRAFVDLLVAHFEQRGIEG
jgi:DNA-binding transcriptional LysR family regulator